MSLKKPSFDAIADAINTSRHASNTESPLTTGTQDQTCTVIATKIANYFASQNKDFDKTAFLRACGNAAPQQNK